MVAGNVALDSWFVTEGGIADGTFLCHFAGVGAHVSGNDNRKSVMSL